MLRQDIGTNEKKGMAMNDQKRIVILAQPDIFDKPYLYQIIPKIQVSSKLNIPAHANHRIFKKKTIYPSPTTLFGEVLRLEGLTDFLRLEELTALLRLTQTSSDFP